MMDSFRLDRSRGGQWAGAQQHTVFVRGPLRLLPVMRLLIWSTLCRTTAIKCKDDLNSNTRSKLYERNPVTYCQPNLAVGIYCVTWRPFVSLLGPFEGASTANLDIVGLIMILWFKCETLGRRVRVLSV